MNLVIIDVPLNHGADANGSELAFDKLKAGGLLEIIKQSPHNLKRIESIIPPFKDEDNKYLDHPTLKYLKPVYKVNQELAQVVYDNLNKDNFPLIIGGDHSLAIGSVAGASKYYKNLAVIWIDAHADMNTPKSSKSHNIHGMPLAVSLNKGEKILTNVLFNGQKVKAKDVYHIGGIDIEPLEYDIAKSLAFDFYTMDYLREKGIIKTLDKIIKIIKSQAYDGIHLSFDIDVMSAKLAPGTGYPANNGFTMKEVKLVLKKLLNEKFITSIDFVEYNPDLDDKDETTLLTALEIIEVIVNEL